MQKSLYSKFVLEREGVSTHETENFFFTYKNCGEEFHVFDMFIDEQSRCTDAASKMMEKIRELWRASGCKYIVASAIAGLPNSEKSLKLQFRWGMKLLKCEGNKIITYKDIAWEA